MSKSIKRDVLEKEILDLVMSLYLSDGIPKTHIKLIELVKTWLDDYGQTKVVEAIKNGTYVKVGVTNQIHHPYCDCPECMAVYRKCDLKKDLQIEINAAVENFINQLEIEKDEDRKELTEWRGVCQVAGFKTAKEVSEFFNKVRMLQR